MGVDYERKVVVQYQGDPKLFLNGEGSYLFWSGGQCVMDQGLENAVFISLFTQMWPETSPLGHYTNYLFDDIAVHVGSDFERIASAPITFASLNDTRLAAEQALEWMTKTSLAKEITVEVTNPIVNRLSVAIRIKRPDLTDTEILLIKNGENWIYQTTDPAHQRGE